MIKFYTSKDQHDGKIVWCYLMAVIKDVEKKKNTQTLFHLVAVVLV